MRLHERAHHLIAVMMLAALPLPCAGQRTTETRFEVSIMPHRGGHPLILAVGDSLRLKAMLLRCMGDVCDVVPHRGVPEWGGTIPGFSISRSGVVRATQPGRFPIDVRLAKEHASDTIRVLPPVRSIRWSGAPTKVSVGDTLRLQVVAQDSSGRVVGVFPASESIGGTGRHGVILNYDDNGYTVVYLDRPGRMRDLIGHLAHRVDTLRLYISP